MSDYSEELNGLRDLLIRERPDDVVKYCADYFNRKLAERAQQQKSHPSGGSSSSSSSSSAFKGFNTHVFTADPTARHHEHKDPKGDGNQEHARLGTEEHSESAEHPSALPRQFPTDFNANRRTSVSAESMVPGRPMASRRQAPIPELSEEQIDRLKKTVGQNFLFKYMDEESIREVLGALQEKKVNNGTNIITQGEEGDYFYIIESGSVDFYKDGEKVNSSGPGSSFGELALLYNSPRAATVTATTDCVLWALDRVSFRHIILEQSANKRAMYMGFLREVPLLKDLNSAALAKLSDAMKLQIYGPGEVIVRQGEVGEDFYIIEYGTCEVSRKEEGKITQLSKGDYFGEVALLNDLPRQATVTASSRAKVLSLDKSGFKRLLGEQVLNTLKRQDPTHQSQ
uniref:cAMP-dependent protein kinase regulatory subunit n=1 Tax=Blastobotrys adeninivorans TaxID=409370 RepID=A0A060T2H1_BLAAD